MSVLAARVNASKCQRESILIPTDGNCIGDGCDDSDGNVTFDVADGYPTDKDKTAPMRLRCPS